MQFYFIEQTPSYHNYQFPYQVYVRKEHGDELFRMYQMGLLPVRDKKDWFYLARSARVRLSNFQPSSENRRILRKLSAINLLVQPVVEFDYTAQVQKFCHQYAVFLGEKQGRGRIMSTASIRKLFTGQANTNYVFKYIDDQGQLVGLVAAVITAQLVHYAYPFINLSAQLGPELSKNLNIGMMTQAVQWSKQQHKHSIYLGTVYTRSARYKLQFAGFEYFTGWSWSDQLPDLKQVLEQEEALVPESVFTLPESLVRLKIK